MMSPKPPAVWRAVLTILLPSTLRRDALDELDDRFAALVANSGPTEARRWYRRQALRCVAESPGRFVTAIRACVQDLAGGGFARDLNVAFRGLRRAPGFTTATVGVLAIGIGGAVAVSSVLSSILLRPLPYQDPDRLAIVWTFNERQQQRDGSSPINTADWLERSQTLDGLALFVRPAFSSATLTVNGRPARIQTGAVTANFFSILGVEAVEGRLFGPADLATDPHVAVASRALLDRLGSSGLETGELVVDLDSRRVRIVGVAPDSLALPTSDTELWVLEDPATLAPMMQTRRSDLYVVLARVTPPLDVEAARNELAGIARQLAVEFPDTNADFGVDVTPLAKEVLGDRLPTTLWMLMGAVLLLLLVAASNAGHLVLLRAARREREVAVRSALGASPLRVGRPLALEGLLIGLGSTVLGIALGAAGLQVLLRAAPTDVPGLDRVSFDWLAVGLGTLAAMTVAPIFAVLPAVLASRRSPVAQLRTGGRLATRPHARLTRGLVLVELTLAVTLLAETGLVIRSAQMAGRVDPGFAAREVLVATVDLDSSTYDTSAKVHQFHADLRSRLLAIPGVRGAGAVDNFFLRRFPDQTIVLPGGEPADAPPRLTTDLVTEGFVDALGLRLLDGRLLEHDPSAPFWPPRTVLINHAMAEAFWPGQSAVGQRFWYRQRTPNDPGVVVAGVVSDFRRERLESQPFPTAYALSAARSMDVIVRTDADPMAIADDVRRAVAAVDPAVPASNVATAWSKFETLLDGRFFQVWLLGSFSTMTLLLAAVGLFTLLSDAVVARRREIGVRLALGATPAHVRRLVLVDGIGLAATGLAAGLACAFGAAQLTEHLLFGVTATDPLTLGGVIGGLLAVAAFASWLPAFRASHVPLTRILTED